MRSKLPHRGSGPVRQLAERCGFWRNLMNRLGFGLSKCVFRVGLTILIVFGLAAELPAQTGRLVGSVVDQTGSAIAGANVSLLLPGGERPLFTVVTSAEGLFSIPSVRPDQYDLVVEAS